MEYKYNLFIQFQSNTDLNNVERMKSNIEEIKKSKLLYKKVLDHFNITAYVKSNPMIFNLFRNKIHFSWLKNIIYHSTLSQDNGINDFCTNSLSDVFSLGNMLLVFDKNKDHKYTLYDDIKIVDGNILNASNSYDTPSIYYYNTLDEVYEHLNFLYIGDNK